MLLMDSYSPAPVLVEPINQPHDDVKPSEHIRSIQIDGIWVHHIACGSCGMLSEFDIFEIRQHGGIPDSPDSPYSCKCCGKPIFYAKGYRDE